MDNADHAARALGPGVDLIALALEAVPKALVYLAVLLIVGVSTARVWLLARAGESLSLADRSHVQSSLARLGSRAAAVLVGALLLRAWGHTAASFGLGESLSWESFTLIAWESAWGQGWQVQISVAVALAFLARSAGSSSDARWSLADLAALAMCYALPLHGHAEGELPGILLHGTHILAGGVWVGTLAAVMLTVGPERRTPVLRAFAPLGFAGSAVLAVSGGLATWEYLGTPMQFVETPYGRTLGLKLILVLDVATFGFLNWRRHHRPMASPAQGETGGAKRTAPPEPLVLIETLTAVAVVLVTAVLTELEHP